MARFKVGDYVTIARLSKHSSPEWGCMLGKTVRIDGVSEESGYIPLYRIEHADYDFWYEDELEPSKEHKVLEILRKWNQTIKKTGV